MNSTKGIEILPHYFVTQDRQYFRINIWDFGGQEIYHATHQFFLTRRSLYILVSGNRAEDTDFYYWLQTINLLSENSPLVIVQNEMQDRKRDINIEAMKERFSIIKKSFSFNFSSNKNALRSLVHEIHNQVVKLPHIGTELPKIWVDIRKILEDIAEEKAYISEFEYLKICSELGMREKERALFLSDYFHDLGVFLHFKDNALLKRWIILKPDWGTEAVYKVLDDENVIANNGYFNKEDLKKIWSDSTYVDMHDELISLMMKFELCYQLESSETYIAAQLLKRKKPKYNWIDTDNLIVRYEYDFMPKGVITRFIVRMNFYIEDQRHVWREGVILERYETRAEVIETYGSREIRIRLSGKHKKEFLAIILDSFDKIHLSYSNLIVKKLIPCNCVKCSSSTTKHYFEYNILKNFLANGHPTSVCLVSYQHVQISPLIDDVFGRSIIKSSGQFDVFVSYNDSDVEYKKTFEKHFKVLGRKSSINFIDKSQVAAGENVKAFIRDKIDTCKAIMCLISSDYLSDQWNYDIELSKAIDRSDTKTCLLIPVIIRDCNWEDAPINNLKPVLFGNSPLFSNHDKVDEYLTDAVNQVKRSIENFIKNQDEFTDKTI